MSYILDALRRADAERTHGQVPGLHDQGVRAAAVAEGGLRSRRGLTWLLAALAAALLVALVATLLWSGRARESAPAVAAPPLAPSVVAAPPAPMPASPPAPAPVVAPAPAPVPAGLPVVVTDPSIPRPQALAVERAPAPAASAAAVPLASLSPEQRRALPPLAIGGWVWSESAAQRFVVINGALLHEGEAAAAGVTLERIGPRSVILRWREGRVEVPL